MPRVLVTDLSGRTKEITPEVGETLMEAIRDAGFDDLQAICGGCCSCATCHVYVDEAWLELTSELDGLVVTIAPSL